MSTSIRAFVFAGAVVSLLPGSSISEEPKAAGYVVDSYTGTGSIVTGGQIESDLADCTAHVDSTGRLVVLPIDWVPGGPRA